MSTIIVRESPQLISVQVQGRITAVQWQATLDELAKTMGTEPSAVLVASETFAGWEPGGWDTVMFSRAHEPLITRMAIVGDAKWEEKALLFAGEGLRRFEMKFFTVGQMPQARQWLASPSS